MNMKENGLTAPTSGKAPVFKVETKRGVSLVPYLKGTDYQTAIETARKDGGNVASRSAAYISLIVASIRRDVDAFTVEPTKENPAGQIMAETEAAVFGKDGEKDPLWRSLKSRYLSYYRKHTTSPPWREKDGTLWIMPARAIQAIQTKEKPESDPFEAFEDRVQKFTEQKISRDNAQEVIATADYCLALLARMRDNALLVVQGKEEQVAESGAEIFGEVSLKK